MPELRPREVIRALETLGFIFERQSGAHAIYRHPDGRTVPVPIHPATLRTPILHRMAGEVGIRLEELVSLGRRRRPRRS